MVLFEIFGIEFNIGALLSFAIGIIAGFVILFLIYLYAVLKSFSKKTKIKKTREDVDQFEVEILIKDAQNKFKDKAARKEIGFFKYLTDLCKELSYDIAKKFFPKSKNPYLEITAEETLLIGHYTINRINQIFDYKLLRMFKGMTLKQIMGVIETKKNFDNSKIVQESKKAGVHKFSSAVMKTLNIVNPVYWIRKLVMDNAVTIIINRMALAAIAIVGEETYKVYSKKLFESTSFTENMDQLYEELERELKENMKRDKEESQRN